MIAILFTGLFTLTAHASVPDGNLVNPAFHQHGFLALTAEEAQPDHDTPEHIARLEQKRADNVCNFLGSPSGPFFTRHAEGFALAASPARGSLAAAYFDEQNQTWRAGITPIQEAYAFAAIHCAGD